MTPSVTTKEFNIRYWGRKPPKMVAKYIKRYTSQGDLVLDPFGGSGSIISTALSLKRRGIYVDLNPFAKLIAHATIAKCDVTELEKAVESIQTDTRICVQLNGRKSTIHRQLLFSVKCTCGRIVEANCIIYTRLYSLLSDTNGSETPLRQRVLDVIRKSRGITHEELVSMLPETSKIGITSAIKHYIKKGVIREEVVPVEIFFASACECGRQKIETNRVMWVIRGNVKPASWYPSNSLRYSNGEAFLKKRDVERVNELFDDRSLAVLADLWQKIKSIKCSHATKKCLLMLFMATLNRSSKMCRTSGGTWPINSYWIPRKFVVRNPVYVFARAASALIHYLKNNHNRPKVRNLKTVYRGYGDVAFLLRDAKKLPLPQESIDYVITDPPHTDEAQFLELSEFYNSWLGIRPSFKNEITVNHKQNKGLKDYYEMISAFSNEIYRILKPGKYFTVILHEEDKSILRRCQNVIEKSGFLMEKHEKVNGFSFYTFKKY